MILIEQVKISDCITFCPLGSYLNKKEDQVFLSLTETRLLCFFFTNRKKRIFVSEIIDFMDNFSKYQSEQNIYVYISRIRNKLEDDPANPEFLLNLRPGYFFNV
jgi:two-component system response regulator RegX3